MRNTDRDEFSEQLADDRTGIYAPELFPALDFKMKNITWLIFHSGKVIATGAKRQADILETFALLYPLLDKYKRIP